MLAFGLPGRGKTHALCAVGHELVRQGHTVLFLPAYKLVQRLLIAKRELEAGTGDHRAIRSVGVHDLPLLVRWLDHPTGDVQQVARETLEKGGAGAVILLMEGWPSLRCGGRWQAVKALATIGMGSAARGKLLDLGLSDEDPGVRLLAAELASRDESRVHHAIAVCVTLALEAEPCMARRAVAALGAMRDGEAVLAAVRPYVEHSDAEVRARLRQLIAEIEDRSIALS